MVGLLFLAVPQDCLWFVIVVFSDHTHLLFMDMGSMHIIQIIKLMQFGRYFMSILVLQSSWWGKDSVCFGICLPGVS